MSAHDPLPHASRRRPRWTRLQAPGSRRRASRTSLGRRFIASSTATLLLGALAACGASDGPADAAGPSGTPDGDVPTIVASTTILADVTSNVVGDAAVVETLLPAGADPHSFEPSAAQVALLHDADLVVTFGLGLEAGLSRPLESAEASGTPVLELAPQLAPIPFRTGDHGDHAHEDDDHEDDDHEGDGSEDHDHEAGELDPHVWTDPDRMATAAHLIAEALAEHSEVDLAGLDANVTAFEAQLRLLDEDIQATLAAIPAERRVLVTNHHSLGYFAERYGFEVVGTVIPGGSTMAESSAAALGALVELVHEHDVPAVFTEVGVDASVARSLAAEVGGAFSVVELHTDALGEPGSGADTYVGLMETNARLIAEALAG